jgi:ribose-phosphate pyrophosphokinase
VAVHALFEADALWRLLEAGVAVVVTCDSVPHSTTAIALAPLIAKATRAIAQPGAPRK